MRSSARGTSSSTPAPDALRFVTRLVTGLQPRHILELGSGLSTRALARACGELPGRRAVSSIDHDPEFGPAAARALVEAGYPHNVRVRCHVAPVVARDCGGRLHPVYCWRTAALAARRAVDLAIIDGPPSTLGGRHGTLYQLMDLARPGTVVVLDDAARPGEQAALREWQDALGPAVSIRYFAEFAKGLAVILVRDAVPRDALWRHQQELCAAELDAVIPARARYLQPARDEWDREMLAGREWLAGDFACAPPDDTTALALLPAAVRSADFLVLLWPSFWWLETYPRFIGALDQGFPCPIRHARMRVYDLRVPVA